MSWAGGKWQAPAYFGTKDEKPEWLDVVVVLADQAASQFFSDWAKEGCEKGQYLGISADQLEQRNITEKVYITVQTRD